ncbi:MAG: hypothetical protein J0M08_07635 [Bacteroidetes bacterium]|nr:hypothetical protein [Bacteroidota bacterium]
MFSRKGYLFILLLVITVVLFLPTLNNKSINLDDPQYVFQNTDIQDFKINNIKLLFKSTYVGNYQPISMFTYLIDYKIWGANAKGFHLTNLIFHTINTLLLFYLITFLFKNSQIAFISALLFSIHPMHVESVAWISARKDLVYVFFSCFQLFFTCYLNKKGKNCCFFFR